MGARSEKAQAAASALLANLAKGFGKEGGSATGSFSTRSSQLLAAFFLSFIVPILMAVSTAMYLATTSLMFAAGINGTAAGGAISFILAVSLVIAIFWCCQKWVSTGGFGWFDLFSDPRKQ